MDDDCGKQKIEKGKIYDGIYKGRIKTRKQKL
jgi:hypothetical protein